MTFRRNRYRIINLATGNRLDDELQTTSSDKSQKDAATMPASDDKNGGYGDSSGFSNHKPNTWIG